MAKKGKNPRGMYQRESGMWYSRIAGVDGKMIRKPLSMDKQTSQIMLNELRKQIDLQRAGIIAPNAQQEYKTFEELRARYVQHLTARALSGNTLDGFQFSYKRVVLENSFVYLRDMSLPKIEEWAQRQTASGVRGQTVNYYVGSIRRALKWAHDNGFLRYNALANWQAVRNNEARLRRDFRPEEIHRFFAAEDDEDWRLRWLIYFSTGLRSTAGRAVCWEWIDWDERILRLPLEHNKSRRVLEVPISKQLFDALAARKVKLGGVLSGPVFPTVQGYTIRARLGKICRKAGIDPHGICVHSIRHTVATMIYNNTDGNLKAVQEILGHTNPSTTMRYLHVTGEEKRLAVDALDLFEEKKLGEENKGDTDDQNHIQTQ